MDEPLTCIGPDELAAFAEGKLSGQAQTRAEEHVDACSSCRELYAAILAQQSVSPASEVTSETVAASGRAKKNRVFDGSAGQQIDRYIVKAQIGSGGMGVVLLAHDPDLGRSIVLKLLRHDVGGYNAEVRLQREAQAMARLSHNHVVTVYDVGTVERQVFIAMEFIDGGTLKDWLREDKRSSDEILSLFGQAGAGLSAAHEAGIVHRDFKPTNVLVSAQGSVKVTDFGLAMGVQRGPEAASERLSLPRKTAGHLLTMDLTQAGTYLGTPAYSSPEQLKGATMDHRSDQFSFCVALYEALYGIRPFAGKTPAELLESMRSQELARPERDAKLIKSQVDAITRGLRFEPDERHADMSSLLAALRGRTHKRARLLWMAAAASAALALTALYVFAVKRPATPSACEIESSRIEGTWSPASRNKLTQIYGDTTELTELVAELDDYSTRWRRAYLEACEETRVHGEQDVATMKLRTDCLGRRQQDLDTLIASADGTRGLEEVRDDAAQLLDIDDCATRSGASEIDDTRIGISDRKEAREIASMLDVIDRDLQRHDYAAALRGLEQLGTEQGSAALGSAIGVRKARIYFLQMRTSRASEEAEAALELAVEANDSRIRMQALELLIYLEIAVRNTTQTARWLRQAEASAKADGALVDLPERLSLAHAAALERDLDFDAAAALLDELAQGHGAYGLVIARRRARLYALTGQPEKAIALLQGMNESDSAQPFVRAELAALLLQTGTNPSTIRALQESILEELEARYASGSLPLARQRLYVGWAQLAAGDAQAALASAEAARESTRESIGTHHLGVIESHTLSGAAYEALDQFSQAASAYAQSSSLYSRAFGIRVIQDVHSAIAAGTLLAPLDARRAEQLFASAAYTARNAGPSYAREAVVALYGEAWCQHQLGSEQAARTLREAEAIGHSLDEQTRALLEAAATSSRPGVSWPALLPRPSPRVVMPGMPALPPWL